MLGQAFSMYINKGLINKYIIVGENGTFFLPFRMYRYGVFYGNIAIKLSKKEKIVMKNYDLMNI